MKNKKYTVYMMHHSHTDLGYTQTPDAIMHKQVKYIYDVIKYLKEAQNGKEEYKNFVWNCETLYVVEKFLDTADGQTKEEFIKYVKLGKIGISGMYLNMSETVMPEIFGRICNRIDDISKVLDKKITSSMQADVNGFSKEYAKGLVNNGVSNLFACVHTHHGMYPLFKKQTGFRWKVNENDELLVWNGEHYQHGNGFAFAKGAVSVHGFFDDVDFKKFNLLDDDSWMDLTKERFEKYINILEEDGYEYDFIPLQIHGKFTDNSMPNPDISNRIDRWNKIYGDYIEVRMCTLDDFFEKLSEKKDKLPVYEGEWPDWWTDGAASAPSELKMYKNYQILYEDLRKLDKDLKILGKDGKVIDENLVLYSEHTFGSHDSISNPYSSFAHTQWAAKRWNLFDAMKKIDSYKMRILSNLNSTDENFKIADKFKVMNLSDNKIKKLIEIPYQDSDWNSITGNFIIKDDLGNNLDYNLNLKNSHPEIVLELEPRSEVQITSDIQKEVIHKKPYMSRINIGGSDQVDDVLNPYSQEQPLVINNDFIETEFLKISWNETGVYSLIDKVNSEELLVDDYGLVSPIYECTSDIPRHHLGRNRKSKNTLRDFGKIIGVKLVDNNINYIRFYLEYEVVGFNEYKVFYTLYKFKAGCNIKIQMEKQINSQAENVYISLPFLNEQNEVLFDKSTDVFIPWKEQLPGTLTDYYSVYAGAVVKNKNIDILISTPDTQLIQLGDINYKSRILMGDRHLKQEKKQMHVWLMNNIWETNFIKNLAGYYEFDFNLEIVPKDNSKNQIERLKALNSQILIFPI